MSPEEFLRAKRAATIGSQADRTPSTKATVTGILGAGVGGVIGQYSGIFLLIPLIATVAIGLLGRKLFTGDRRAILPAFSVQAGHLAWLLLGVMMTRQLGADVIDLVWMSGGLLWLAAKPGRGPLWMLGVYQFLVLIINVYVFAHSPLESSADRALLIHLIWRLLALFLMGKLYMEWRRTQVDVAVGPTL